MGQCGECGHYLAISHDRRGCKLCDCALDDKGRNTRPFGPLVADKGKRKKRPRGTPLVTQIILLGGSLLAVAGGASAAILPNLMTPPTNPDEKYYQGLLVVYYLVLLFGVVGVIYSALSSHISEGALKKWIDELEERIDRAGISAIPRRRRKWDFLRRLIFNDI